MKKIIAVFFEIKTLLLVALIFAGCNMGFCQETNNKTTTKVVAKLTVYHATQDIPNKGYMKGFKKGELIVDSNNPLNRLISGGKFNYKYQTTNTEDNERLIPRKMVKATTYDMNELPVSLIGEKAVFVAEDGTVLSIFHSTPSDYCVKDWDEKVDAALSRKVNNSWILSVKLDSGDIFETWINETNGNLDLYCTETHYGGNTVDQGWRYRKDPIGFLEEKWTPFDCDFSRSSFNNGKLINDVHYTDFEPQFISVAYIDALSAMYVNGKLFYRKN